VASNQANTRQAGRQAAGRPAEHMSALQRCRMHGRWGPEAQPSLSNHHSSTVVTKSPSSEGSAPNTCAYHMRPPPTHTLAS
jgi:hypothetical protein